MFKKLDKVLGSLKGKKTTQYTNVDSFTEEQIEGVTGNKIAASAAGQLFGAISELNDYLFLEITVVCKQKIKTFDGARLKFSSAEDTFELNSDTQEIQYDHTKVPNWYMAHISFDVTEDEIEKIRTGAFETIELSWKKNSLSFDKAFTFTDEEE